jgi:hypothetical protein
MDLYTNLLESSHTDATQLLSIHIGAAFFWAFLFVLCLPPFEMAEPLLLSRGTGTALMKALLRVLTPSPGWRAGLSPQEVAVRRLGMRIALGVGAQLARAGATSPRAKGRRIVVESGLLRAIHAAQTR